MRALAWNCRGVNSENSLAIPYIRWLVRKTNPDFVFLSEIKCAASKLDSKFHYMGFTGIIGVDAVNQNGDLSYFAYFLYGDPNLEGRGEVWETLKKLLNANRTYSNEEWRCLFPKASIENYKIIASDHGAILLETSPKKAKSKRPYKIEAWCLEKCEVKEIIKQEWAMETKGSSMFRAMKKQEAVSIACRTWCLNRKKDLGITWDKFKEELEATREETNEEWYGVNEVEKRRQCQEKARDQLMY
ncbi:Plasminogen activator inhibitor 1 [Bienertia sinuspersici]